MRLTEEEREILLEALIDHTGGEYVTLLSRGGNDYLTWAVEDIVAARIREHRRTQDALSESAPAVPLAFLSPTQLAERWGVSTGSLANRRSQGEGVPFVKIGALVRYPLESVLAYEAENTLGLDS